MTSNETTETTRERVRVYFTGSCEGLDNLREALSNHPELEVVGASEQVSQAASALAGGHLGAVLHATRSPSLPVNELAAIREQTAARDRCRAKISAVILELNRSRGSTRGRRDGRGQGNALS